jgi:DNA repair exonuclease SbcCD nuclease subunit
LPRPLKVLHTADVHLDPYIRSKDDYWEERRSLVRQAYSTVIDLGLRERVDLFVIAGDWFDNSHPTEDTVEFALAEVRRLGVPTVVINGNHDPMDDHGPYGKHEFEPRAENLHLIREPEGRWVHLDELHVSLWGRAFYEMDYKFRPFEGLPCRQSDNWHIAVGHGHFLEDDERTERSLPIRASEIRDCGWDYIALGHWEPHADVSQHPVPALYAGAPMPLTDANRRAGLACVVHFDETGVRIDKHRVDPRPPTDDWEALRHG